MGINRRAFLTSMKGRSRTRRQGAETAGDSKPLGQSSDRLSLSSPAYHLRANLAHLNGSGCQAAYMLARLTGVLMH